MALDLADGLVGLVSAIFGLLAAGFYSSRGMLRKQNTDYKERIEFLESEVARLTASDLAKENQIIALHAIKRGDDKLDEILGVAKQIRNDVHAALERRS